jgi:hypothetical protein
MGAVVLEQLRHDSWVVPAGSGIFGLLEQREEGRKS